MSIINIKNTIARRLTLLLVIPPLAIVVLIQGAIIGMAEAWQDAVEAIVNSWKGRSWKR